MTTIPPASDLYDTEAVEAIGDLKDAIAGVHRIIGETENRFREGFAAVTDCVRTVADELDQAVQEVEAVAGAIATAVRQQVQESAASDAEWRIHDQTLRTHIDSLQADLAALPGIAQALDEKASLLQSQLETRMKEASSAQEEMLAALKDGTNTATESIESARDSVEELVSEFQETLDSVCDAIEELMTATVEDLDERLEQVMITTVNAATESLEQLAELIAGQAVPQVVEDVATTLVADLTGVIDDLLSTFRDVLTRLRQQLFEGAGETGQSRAAVELALDQMQFLLDPIRAEIGRIRGLASSVGIGV